ncbi:hypothetical protein N7528_006851 [Penicillium herquei]|nr:hypothetical protein N7528_006851 [Penicillium herquei]
MRMENDDDKLRGKRVCLKRSNSEEDELTEDGSEYNEFDDSEEEEWWREGESGDLNSQEDIEEHEYTISGDTSRPVKIDFFDR